MQAWSLCEHGVIFVNKCSEVGETKKINYAKIFFKIEVYFALY